MPSFQSSEEKHNTSHLDGFQTLKLTVERE